MRFVFCVCLFFLVACGGNPLPYSARILVPSEDSKIRTLGVWATEELYRSSSGKTRTNAIFVSQKGRVLLEAYASEFGPNSLHPLWSVSKFLMNGALGQAVREGRISLQDPVTDHLAESKELLNKNLKVKDLLFFASGIDWKERYEWMPFQSDILEILYGSGRTDIGGYVSSLGFSESPGLRVSYSSGDSNLLSAILTRTSGKDYPHKFLHSVGIESFVWERDGKGIPISSSYLYLSARDLAKLGEFYKNEMRGNPSGVFPGDWIDRTFISLEEKSPKYLNWIPFPSMGGHVYLNRYRFDSSRPFHPSLSGKAFFASGHWGQFLVVDPEKDLIVVRLGNDRGKRFPMGEFLDRLVSILEERGNL
ncbi:serine hydrolase domain-containing protein [Leptospira wolffii]|uniref:serine hydrolase domain-containing protein n=1 Tax=Leptospira wolffii TaxID=409998 RepID=UPI0002E6EF6F|nr:serine hydrolase [Leptospira wolffii]EPG66737.1 beta-lactamase [Leptospira wolffii serovar Khorat str. Khorat-H2]